MPLKNINLLINKIPPGISWSTYHPAAVLAGTTKLSDAIALLDSNIHFITVHQLSNNLDANMRFPIGKMFSRFPHIIIPEKGKTFFEVLEAAQASSFAPSGSFGVVSGTCDIMKTTYPEKDFIGNQKNPDVLQAYNESTVPFKGFVGGDFKNAMAKLAPHGRNQIIIGNNEQYLRVLNDFEITLSAVAENMTKLKPILKQLAILAKSNNWVGQITLLTLNAHLFPSNYIPPLSTKTKFPLETLTPQEHLKVILAKRKLRWLSKLAYENNVPEDHFTQSHIQELMSAPIPTDTDLLLLEPHDKEDAILKDLLQKVTLENQILELD